MALGVAVLLLPVVRECFDPSRRKQDFELRIEQLQLQLQDVVNEMQTLITRLRRNLLLLDGADKISLRRIHANGIVQLVWQFHEIRSEVWRNGRHGAMQVLMPVEALDSDKLLAVRTAVSFRRDDYFLHAFKEYELHRISLNLQAKTFFNVMNLIKMQSQYRGITLFSETEATS